MIVTYEELKKILGEETTKKLFKDGNLTAWVQFKVNGFIVEYSPVAGKYYLGWVNDRREVNK